MPKRWVVEADNYPNYWVLKENADDGILVDFTDEELERIEKVIDQYEETMNFVHEKRTEAEDV